LVLTLTLDNCCIIDVLDDRPGRLDVEAIVAAHREGRAQAYIVTSTASELLRDRTARENYSGFIEVLREAGMDDLPQLPTPATLDFSYLDHCVLVDDDIASLADEIRAVLFGPRQATATEAPIKWRNQTCDVLAMWAHISHSNDIFVTSDRNFHKRTKKDRLAALGAHAILTPAMAARRVPVRG
jgi:hypothetical protein